MMGQYKCTCVMCGKEFLAGYQQKKTCGKECGEKWTKREANRYAAMREIEKKKKNLSPIYIKEPPLHYNFTFSDIEKYMENNDVQYVEAVKMLTEATR